MECRVEFDYQAQEPDELTLKKGDIINNVVTKMDGWWEGTLHGKRGMFPDNFVKVISGKTDTNEKKSGAAGDEGSSTGVNFRKNSAGNARRLKALFSYSPEQDDELSLAVGDIIDFISEVEEGWWKGQLKGRTGIFPSNFVADVADAEAENKLKTDTPDIVDKVPIKQETTPEPTISSEPKRPPAVIKDSPDVVPTPKQIVAEEPAPKLPPKPIREMARCFYNYTAQNEDELSMKEGDIVYILSRECEDDGWWKGELKGKVGVFPDNFVKIVTPNDPIGPPGPFNLKAVTAQERSIDEPMQPTNLGFGKIKKEPSQECKAAETAVHNKIQKLFERDDSQTEKENTSAAKAPSIVPKKTKEAPPVPAQPKTATTPTSPASPFGAFLPRLYERSENGIIRSNSRGRSQEKEITDAEDFNSVERGQTLTQLTVNRAKPPKRRPPSSPSTRDSDPGVLNGLGHGDFAQESSPNHTSASDASAKPMKEENSLPADLAETSASPTAKEVAKESPSTGATSISKPKMVVPWITELKKKQDKKQVQAPSQATSSPPNAKDQVDTVVTPPQPQPITTRAPPLPAKPSLPPFPNTSSLDRDRPTAHSPTAPTAQSTTNNGFGHTSAHNAPHTKNAPVVASKFGAQRNYMNVSNDRMSPDLTKEFVSVEDYNALKEKVTALESELELVKKQLKVALDRDFSKGHVV